MASGPSDTRSESATNTTTVNKTVTDSYNSVFNSTRNTVVQFGDLSRTIPGIAEASAGPDLIKYALIAGVALVASLRLTK